MSARSESAIFEALSALAAVPGFGHAIAYFCLRDNMTVYSEEMLPKDMEHQFGHDRLIRSEISTLIGLLIKNNIDWTPPDNRALQLSVNGAIKLLAELHQSMLNSFMNGVESNPFKDNTSNPFSRGHALREPIFYSGESAYSFQFRDFAARKYANDDAWLIYEKGFSIKVARHVVHAVTQVLDRKAIDVVKSLMFSSNDCPDYLAAYTFTVQDIAEKADIDIDTVQCVLRSFTLAAGDKNEQFESISDFNVANAFPLIPVSKNTYVLYSPYNLVQSLYESPFYWMVDDKKYIDSAAKNRGEFTESITADRLRDVFGHDRVYSNVELSDSSGDIVGEIDVLVLFEDRAIIVQAKSKKLTIESRKGNDQAIRNDFQKSIQSSCDQAYKCAKLIQEKTVSLRCGHLPQISVPANLRDIYVLCVVSDHYPALSFQARQFLTYGEEKRISAPFVLDVFTVDVLAEMLPSPLRLLSYIDRRTHYNERVLATHELTILSYHLKTNLWLEDEYDMFVLDDEVALELDLAMMARRDGIPARSTPDGILTRFSRTTLGRILEDIEGNPDPGVVNLGYTLLTINEKSFAEISDGIDQICRRARRDGKSHDFTAGFGKESFGLTVHCNEVPASTSMRRLANHCRNRKYIERANRWFGVCIRPDDATLRFGLELQYEWERDELMEARLQELKGYGLPARAKSMRGSRRKKVGRNERCPCGSGKKYKKCCLQGAC